jgi:hypothetical protein
MPLLKSPSLLVYIVSLVLSQSYYAGTLSVYVALVRGVFLV